MIHKLQRRLEEIGTTVDWLSITLICSCIVCFAHGAYYLLLGINNPILDWHSFRQTQTALSAYWLWQGGPWFAYETPVVGFPWSIPFEFPVYQGLVALLRGLGVPIDIGGRLLSFGFYLASLWPLWMLCRALSFSRITFLTISVLFLASPIYLYWSRTFMIESCALFFSFLWLALLARLLNGASVACFLGAAISGSLGILAKTTTFPAFAVLGGILILVSAYRAWREQRLIAFYWTLGFASMACLIPFIIGFAWVLFCDSVKLRNPFGTLLTSTKLVTWNFGTWDQRLSLAFWNGVVLKRIFPDIFGYGAALAAFIVGAALVSRRHVVAILALLLAFWVPLLVFTNLHMVHNYYQYANAIFALAAVGVAVAGITETRWRGLAVAALAIVVFSQFYYFHRIFSPVVHTDYAKDRVLQIALLAREKTQPDESLIVLGQDWSSAVPYYSERKSFVVAGWSPKALLQQVFENPQEFLGNYRLAAIVFCSDKLAAYGDKAPMVSEFVANRALLGEIGGCQLLAGQR